MRKGDNRRETGAQQIPGQRRPGSFGPVLAGRRQQREASRSIWAHSQAGQGRGRDTSVRRPEPSASSHTQPGDGEKLRGRPVGRRTFQGRQGAQRRASARRLCEGLRRTQAGRIGARRDRCERRRLRFLVRPHLLPWIDPAGIGGSRHRLRPCFRPAPVCRLT